MSLAQGSKAMNNVVEIGIAIGIDHKGNADMFDPDPDPDTE
jgi:hypothetical protein